MKIQRKPALTDKKSEIRYITDLNRVVPPKAFGPCCYKLAAGPKVFLCNRILCPVRQIAILQEKERKGKNGRSEQQETGSRNYIHG